MQPKIFVNEQVNEWINQSREIITIKTGKYYIKDLILDWHKLHMGKFTKMIMRNQDILYNSGIWR